jgi:hypothetical protein
MLLALRSLWENAVSVFGGAPLKKKRKKPRRVYQPRPVDVVIQGTPVAASPAIGMGELSIGVELYDYEIAALLAN